MKIAIVQFNPKIGDFANNLSRLANHIENAKAQYVDLVVFPELAICGYPPKDYLDFESFVTDNEEFIEQLTKVTQNITVICGYVGLNNDPSGPRFRNLAAVLKNGSKVLDYQKCLLPTYDVFDEDRYFSPGNQTEVFELHGKKIGLSICEDLWNEENFAYRNYDYSPANALKEKKVDLVINLSASPFSLGKPKKRESLFKKSSQNINAPIIFCNQVGGNDELLFDGCSFVATPDGEIPLRLPSFKESLTTFELGKPAPREPLWPDSEGEWLFNAVALGLRDYVEKCGLNKVVLGLSGGIDSAVVAVIAARALGRDSVSAIALPTRYTSDHSNSDAQTLASNLGVRFETFSIENLFSNYLKEWKKCFQSDPKSTTQENLQPRIRMSLLMALSNEENSLLLNTSNKSEIATGYSTLYGDSAGAISPLGDLTKTQVYLVARYINRISEVIPNRIIDRAPSAELKENQTDQDTLPDYQKLDSILNGIVIEGKSKESLAKDGHSIADVEQFIRLYTQSEYKRNQLCPVIRVSERAFGMGRRMPIAAHHPS